MTVMSARSIHMPITMNCAASPCACFVAVLAWGDGLCYPPMSWFPISSGRDMVGRGPGGRTLRGRGLRGRGLFRKGLFRKDL